MTQSAPLDIQHPSLWRLLLHLDAAELTAALMNTAEDASLHLLRIPLPDGPSLAALEEAVYANPLLLSDFRKVDIVVRSPHFILAPGIMDDADCDRLASTFVPDATALSRPFADRFSTAVDDIVNVWAVADGAAANFLARSFNAPAFHHHLSPLVKYFGRSNSLGNSAKLYINLHTTPDDGLSRGQADIIAFGHGGRLVMANTIRFESIDDAGYYILSAAKTSGLNLSSDEIILGGDTTLRAAVIQRLRNFASYVMPAIFPAAALQAGPAAMTMPFPLALIPLCE